MYVKLIKTRAQFCKEFYSKYITILIIVWDPYRWNTFHLHNLIPGNYNVFVVVILSPMKL